MKKWGVLLLLSPPAFPRYNGSIARSLWFVWGPDNETARPWGEKGLTPDEVWQNRQPVTDEERKGFGAKVRKQARWWRKAMAFKAASSGQRSRPDRATDKFTQQDEDEVMRHAISSALRALGYLREWRRRNYSTTSCTNPGQQ